MEDNIKGTNKLVKQAIAHFKQRHGRAPTDDEIKVLTIGSRLSITQLKMSGCMINYPQPDILGTLEFEMRHGRKPNEEEKIALKKGMTLSIEKLKMSGCMINYPSD